MDPRHPEQAISRMRELMEQYDHIEEDMAKATTSAQLAQLEREGGLVVQEICLVAPRIHEAMMQTSRQRRHDLAHGVLDEPQDTLVEDPVENYADVIGEENLGGKSELVEKPVEKSEHRSDIVTDIENPYGEIAIHNAKPEEYIEKPKKTTKKKTTKKAKK